MPTETDTPAKQNRNKFMSDYLLMRARLEETDLYFDRWLGVRTAHAHARGDANLLTWDELEAHAESWGWSPDTKQGYVATEYALHRGRLS